jgi:hypothetical protein
MRRRRKETACLLLGACCLLLAAGSLAAAQTGTGYDLSWWTVDGGGATWSSGAGYQLGGTAGQPDAGLLEGGGYTLGGGFWRGGETAVAPYKFYLPLVLR